MYLGAPREIIEIAKNKNSASGIKQYVKEILLWPRWILQERTYVEFYKD